MEGTTKCHKCNSKALYQLVDKRFCKKCFADLIEQKIKQNLRKYKIKKDSVLLVKDDCCKYFINKIIKLPVKIVDRGKHDHHVMPYTLDDDNEEFLTQIIQAKKKKQNKKEVRLFLPVSKKDMKHYLEIKKIPCKFQKTKINNIMDEFEKKHPGTKTALLKSSQKT